MIELIAAAVVYGAVSASDPITEALEYPRRLDAFIARTEAREAAAAERVEVATAASRNGTRTPTSSNVTLACIREHESGGSYTIVNEWGYAGAYQLSPEYKDDWAIRYGYPEWANVPVPEWPAAVQDAVALALGLDSDWHMWSDYAPYTCPGF